jgi:hypothetical protein
MAIHADNHSNSAASRTSPQLNDYKMLINCDLRETTYRGVASDPTRCVQFMHMRPTYEVKILQFAQSLPHWQCSIVEHLLCLNRTRAADTPPSHGSCAHSHAGRLPAHN